ncbi:hypothetical protein ULG90_21915 [Halopseudomonas pachastrellae]|nr:hypothetical protein ULG90_21915 [Halopseudomonas pachastrellae]
MVKLSLVLIQHLAQALLPSSALARGAVSALSTSSRGIRYFMVVSPDWVVSARVRSLFLIWSLLMALFFALLAWLLFWALFFLVCSHVFAYSLFLFGNYWRV